MARKPRHEAADKVWGLTRISLGFVFLWAFLDKLFGLGYATCKVRGTDIIERGCDAAWMNGGSPTSGFLNNAVSGPFADFYSSLAGKTWVDWLFMLGLLGIGVGLTFGIAMKLSTISGALMMILMYTAALPPANNPIIDDHIVYALVLIGLLLVNDRQAFGFGHLWKQNKFVKENPWLV